MRKLFILITVVLLIGLSFFYKTGSQKKENNQINLVINDPIKTFDPAVAFNDDALLVMAQSLETLYQYHYLKRPYEVIPALAAEMPTISEDGLVYRIKIKKGIHYQNSYSYLPEGREVKVDDFFWQIKRLAYRPLKSNGTWLFAGKLKGFNEFRESVGENPEKFYTEEISGLKKIDDHTFEIHLSRPEPNLLYFLSMQFTSPVPVELIKKLNNKLDSVLVGTGPYQYEGFENNMYYLKKFDNYREEYYPSSGDRYANTEKLLTSSKEKLPFIKNVIFHVVSDEDQRWEEFKDGNIDILDVPKKYLSQLSNPDSKVSQKFKANGVSIKHFSRQTTRWLGFNMHDQTVGTNLNLRRAIAHAIDYEKYIQVLTNNTNLRSNSIFNPSIQGYNPSHSLPYQYDLAKAKEYLKKSGLDPKQIDLSYSTRGTQELNSLEANFLKEQLAKLGINLKINMISFGDFLKKGRAGKLQFWTDNWIYDYPDAENLLQLLISKNHPGINKSGYSNKQVDHLYNKLSRTLDREERFAIMYEIEKIVEEELPWIMMMYESTYMIQQKEIKNFRKSFFIRNFVKYLEKK